MMTPAEQWSRAVQYETHMMEHLSNRTVELNLRTRNEHPFTNLFACKPTSAVHQTDAAFYILSFGQSKECPDVKLLDDYGSIWFAERKRNIGDDQIATSLAYTPNEVTEEKAREIWKWARESTSIEEKMDAYQSGVPVADLIA